MTDGENGGRGYQYSREELKSALQTVAENEDTVTVAVYNEYDNLPASSVIIDRFGSWVEAKEEAGVGTDERRNNARPRTYSTAELIEMLQECEDRHGRCSQKNFDDDDDFCASGTIVKRFGQWSQAKREAGVN